MLIHFKVRRYGERDMRKDDADDYLYDEGFAYHTAPNSSLCIEASGYVSLVLPHSYAINGKLPERVVQFLADRYDIAASCVRVSDGSITMSVGK